VKATPRHTASRPTRSDTLSPLALTALPGACTRAATPTWPHLKPASCLTSEASTAGPTQARHIYRRLYQRSGYNYIRSIHSYLQCRRERGKRRLRQSMHAHSTHQRTHPALMQAGRSRDRIQATLQATGSRTQRGGGRAGGQRRPGRGCSRTSAWPGLGMRPATGYPSTPGEHAILWRPSAPSARTTLVLPPAPEAAGPTQPPSTAAPP